MKKIEALLYVVARLIAAVPATWLAKLKLSVCQPPATVVEASVSTLLVGSAASSTLSRTGVPAVGDQTRTVMVLLVALKPIGAMALLARFETVVPAQSSAVALLITRATLLAAFVGSGWTLESSAPPKPVNTGAAAGGARTYYFEDLSYPTAAATGGGGGGGGGGTTAGLPVTFDSSAITYTLTGFGGAEDATVVVDPAGGTNKVAKVVKSATAELWAGTTVSTGANQSIATIPFTATARTMTVRVYSTAAGKPVRLKVEDAADPTKSVETEAMTTAAGAWQTLTFNFANQAAGTAAINLSYRFNKASIFFNFGTPGAAGGGGTWYFDDLSFVP